MVHYRIRSCHIGGTSSLAKRCRAGRRPRAIRSCRRRRRVCHERNTCEVLPAAVLACIEKRPPGAAHEPARGGGHLDPRPPPRPSGRWGAGGLAVRELGMVWFGWSPCEAVQLGQAAGRPIGRACTADSELHPDRRSLVTRRRRGAGGLRCGPIKCRDPWAGCASLYGALRAAGGEIRYLGDGPRERGWRCHSQNRRGRRPRRWHPNLTRTERSEGLRPFAWRAYARKSAPAVSRSGHG